MWQIRQLVGPSSVTCAGTGFNFADWDFT